MTARIGLAAISLLWIHSVAAATSGSWASTVTSSSPPSFPNPRPLQARYGFRWGGFSCGQAEARLSKPGGDRSQLDANARTSGLARALWKFDATLSSTIEASTLRPISVRQIENDRGKRIVTEVAYNSGGVSSKVTETPGPEIRSSKFEFPRVFDLQSGLLYLRSQPLPDGNVQRIVVCSETAPYLATITVLGRERVTVPAGGYNAIKIDLQLNRIKDNELQPHKKFRRASAWLSDDSDRVLLKIEAQVFVGSVVCELQAVDFENQRGM